MIPVVGILSMNGENTKAFIIESYIVLAQCTETPTRLSQSSRRYDWQWHWKMNILLLVFATELASRAKILLDEEVDGT